MGLVKESSNNAFSAPFPPVRLHQSLLPPVSSFGAPQFFGAPPMPMSGPPFISPPPPPPLPMLSPPPLLFLPPTSVTSEEPIVKLMGRSGTVYQSQQQSVILPPTSLSTPITSAVEPKDDNRHKNKILIHDALKNVQNVGKVKL